MTNSVHIKQLFQDRFNGSLSLIEPFFAPCNEPYGYASPEPTTILGAPRYVVRIDADKIARQTERFHPSVREAYIDAVCFAIKVAVTGIATKRTTPENALPYALDFMADEYDVIYGAITAGQLLVLDLAL